MRSARQVERLVQNEPLFKAVPLWRQVHPTDTKDFEGMRQNLRRWLDTIMIGTKEQRIALLTKFVIELQRDCAETMLLANKRPFKTWGNPVLTVDKNGNLQFGAVPLATGVQARVWYGLILLFARNLTQNVRKCNAAHRGDEPCGNYYLKTKKLWIACSEKCKRILRHQQVYRAVKKIRRRKEKYRGVQDAT